MRVFARKFISPLNDDYLSSERKYSTELMDILTEVYKNRGWGNGYLVIPKGHPLHGKSYDYLNKLFDVHGGLTWSDYGYNTPCTTEEEADDWVVGFDTAHYGDNMDLWPNEESVLMEMENLKFQIINYEKDKLSDDKIL